MSVCIRPMNWRTDREGVLRFQKEIYETNFPGFRMSSAFLHDYEQQMRRALRQSNERLLVLDEEGEVCGFLWLALITTMVEPYVGYIKNIYVAPRWRGRGHARALLEAADDWFRLRGCSKATLDASVCNGRALAVYEAAGYTPARYRMEKVYESNAMEELGGGELL